MVTSHDFENSDLLVSEKHARGMCLRSKFQEHIRIRKLTHMFARWKIEVYTVHQKTNMTMERQPFERCISY